MSKFTCPITNKGKVCGHTMELDPHEAEKNNVFMCEKCGAEFIVTSQKPFRYELLEDDDLEFDDEDDEG